MAISWLEATFPELAQQEAEGGNPATVKAHPYALFDASLSLQVCFVTAYQGCKCPSESMMCDNINS